MKLKLGKKKVLMFIVVSCFVWSLNLKAQTNGEPIRITLDDALEIALSENLTVQVSDQEIKKQEYAKKGTYASLFPQVDLTGSYQRTISKQVMYMDGMGEEMSRKGIEVGRDNSWSGGVTASMPLISVPLWKSLGISSQGVELAIEKARSSRIELIDQVKQAYYTVLLAHDTYEVFRDAYENALKNYNDIERKFNEGLSAEYDVIRANVNVKNAEPNVYDAENSLILAHWQLKALLGLDLEIDLECMGTLADFENQLVKEVLSVNDLTLKNNSTLKQMDIQSEQLRKTKICRLPSIIPH